jgi:hypothetical protein
MIFFSSEKISASNIYNFCLRKNLILFTKIKYSISGGQYDFKLMKTCLYSKFLISIARI